jgi:DNA polymerase-3 subunit gamma/tau
LLNQSDLGGPVGQLALHTVLLGVEGNILRLGMKSAHDGFLSEPLLEQLAKRLGKTLGRPVRVRIEKVGNGTESPADALAKANESRRQEAREGLQSDPAVQSLIDTFGARIISDSVRPLER